MNLDKILHPDITVTGILSIILHVSRIAGTAPLTFERVRGGWRISISRFFICYNYVATIILSVFAAIFACYDREDVIDGYDPSSNSGFMGYAIRILMVMQITVQCTITYNSSYRLRHMIDCLTQVKRVSQILDHLLGWSPTRPIRTWIMVSITILIAYFAAFLEYGSYMYDVVVENSKVPISSYAFAWVFLAQLQLSLLPVQFGTIVLQLVYILKRLNKALKSLLWRLQNDLSRLSYQSKDLEYIILNEKNRINTCSPIFNLCTQQSNSVVEEDTGVSKDAKLVRQLANIYSSLCALIRQFNESNGASLMALLLYVSVAMVTAPYFAVAIMFRNESKLVTVKTVSIFTYCVYCMSMLIMATEPCQQCHYQLKLTKHLIKQTLRSVPREAPAIRYELKMFKRHILLNPVRFCPMKLIRFDRNLTIAILSTSVTYLSVVTKL